MLSWLTECFWVFSSCLFFSVSRRRSRAALQRGREGRWAHVTRGERSAEPFIASQRFVSLNKPPSTWRSAERVQIKRITSFLWFDPTGRTTDPAPPPGPSGGSPQRRGNYRQSCLFKVLRGALMSRSPAAPSAQRPSHFLLISPRFTSLHTAFHYFYHFVMFAVFSLS